MIIEFTTTQDDDNHSILYKINGDTVRDFVFGHDYHTGEDPGSLINNTQLIDVNTNDVLQVWFDPDATDTYRWGLQSPSNITITSVGGGTSGTGGAAVSGHHKTAYISPSKQSDNIAALHRAQGAITALKKLMHMKDEVQGSAKRD